MRELINILNESVGLANRKRGETFINSAGDLLVFQSLTFFPNEGKFDNPKDMNALIADLEARKNTQIEWVNARTAGSSAFGICEFTDTNNLIVLVGRYFSKISPIFTANFWPNSGLPNGFKYNRVAATKMSAGLMPQDVLTSYEGLTVEAIVQQVTAKFGEGHPLTDLTVSLASGTPLPITVDARKMPEVGFTAFRDYFNEILQPIAVINGQCAGNAAEAEAVFLGKGGFADCTISFSTGKNTGLYDSLLTAPGGQEIKISTKGAVGATASIRNLLDAVEELKKAGNTELATKYSEAIAMVKLASQAGQSQAPLLLAEKYGLIAGKETAIVNSMRTSSNVELTKNLQSIYDEKAARSNVDKIIPYYTMLAAIAELVCTYINDNTDFSNAAAEILNHSAVIQVYTDAVDKEGQFVVRKYTAKFPSTAVAGVQFYSGKTYYSSGVKGNFTFKLYSQEGQQDAELDAAPSRPEAEIDADIADVVDRHVNIRPPGTVEPRATRAPAAPRERR